MSELLTFEEAIEDSREVAEEPHLLLGNGFSISCRPESSDYAAPLDEATFEAAHGDVRSVFELLGTTDFERVIELLGIAIALADRYGDDSDLGDRLRDDAEIVREALAQTLAARHPDLPSDISEDEFIAARQFLQHFRKICALDYGMLLYWAVMQDLEPDVPTNAGFTDPDNPDADHVVWEPYLDFRNQWLFFLHGGLHLYDRGVELSKITWSRTGVPLVDQIRDAFATGRYPLIVTVGSSAEKEAKILHNAYLNRAIRSVARIEKTLFIQGHSLAANDQHIFDPITAEELDRLYVSISGDPDSESNQEIVRRADSIQWKRSVISTRELDLRFHDAESANPWG